METTKEMMSGYLERVQRLQRMYLGHSMNVDTQFLPTELGDDVSIRVSVFSDDPAECGYLAGQFSLDEWEDKECNDEEYTNLLDCIKKLGWE